MPAPRLPQSADGESSTMRPRHHSTRGHGGWLSVCAQMRATACHVVAEEEAPVALCRDDIARDEIDLPASDVAEQLGVEKKALAFLQFLVVRFVCTCAAVH